MHPAFTQTGAKLASSAQFSPVFHIMSALKCTGFCFVLFYLDLERLGSCCCLSPSLFVQLIHMTAAADSCRQDGGVPHRLHRHGRGAVTYPGAVRSADREASPSTGTQPET